MNNESDENIKMQLKNNGIYENHRIHANTQ